MTNLAPLAMSQTKDELLKHLNMTSDTYNMMAKEADVQYKWLTSEKRHLKKNCKRKPPYDWSDIVENSKDEAMRRIAQSGNGHTSYYWNLGHQDSGDCPNWIARWFLYHKFRYRDGRNRNARAEEGIRQSSGSSSRQSHYDYNGYAEENAGDYYAQTSSYYPSTSMTSGQTSQPYSYAYPSTGVSSAGSAPYATSAAYSTSYSGYDTSTYGQSSGTEEDKSAAPGYYDPVRDLSR